MQIRIAKSLLFSTIHFLWESPKGEIAPPSEHVLV